MSEKKPSIKMFIGLIVFIFTILLGFIATQEYILNTGEDIYLSTLPIDPRDPLRGDYVILRYTFEESDILKEYITAKNTQKDDVLYLSFERDENNNGRLVSVGELQPDEGIFLKVVQEDGGWRGSNVETGIDKFFVPEGTGRVIERVRGEMSVHVKMAKNGKASIVDLYYQGEKIDPKNFKIN